MKEITTTIGVPIYFPGRVVKRKKKKRKKMKEVSKALFLLRKGLSPQAALEAVINDNYDELDEADKKELLARFGDKKAKPFKKNGKSDKMKESINRLSRRFSMTVGILEEADPEDIANNPLDQGIWNVSGLKTLELGEEPDSEDLESGKPAKFLAKYPNAVLAYGYESRNSWLLSNTPKLANATDDNDTFTYETPIIKLGGKKFMFVLDH